MLLERASGSPSSIALNLICVKCCLGPVFFPNHESFVMLTINFAPFFLFLATILGNIPS